MGMVETSTSELSQLQDDFTGEQLEMVTRAITCGNTRGRLWLNRGSGPFLAMLWDQGNNVFYISGGGDGNAGVLRDILHTTVRDRALGEGAAHFTVRTLSPEMVAGAEAAFAPHLKGTVEKLFYVYTRPTAPACLPGTAEGVLFHEIDGRFLEDERRRNTEAVVNEIQWMWPSLDAYTRHGFGIAAVVDEAVVCWCTAEYVSSTACGIGIETVPEHRNKGIATGTAARFVSQALDRGLRPHWECGEANRPSVRVAEKLGFRLVKRSAAIVGRFG